MIKNGAGVMLGANLVVWQRIFEGVGNCLKIKARYSSDNFPMATKKRTK